MALDPPPPPVAQPAPVEPFVLTIGDIGVTAHWAVTQVGSAPLAGSIWTISDQTRTTRKIPTWAIVLAIFLFPIGLLFLLAKKTVTTGWLEVSVQSGTVHATTQIVVKDTMAIHGIRQKVALAQTMAAAATA